MKQDRHTLMNEYGVEISVLGRFIAWTYRGMTVIAQRMSDRQGSYWTAMWITPTFSSLYHYDDAVIGACIEASKIDIDKYLKEQEF
jgi:hypothetical protein